MEETVYYNLHTYAFNSIKKIINDQSLNVETRNYAQEFLISSQIDVKSSEASNSIYHNKITKYITTLDKELLKKNVKLLTNEEKNEFEKAKNEIDKIINKEIKKIDINTDEVKEQNEQEIEKQLNESNISVIQNEDGTKFAKLNDDKTGEVIVAEMVGSGTTLKDMVNATDKSLEDSFIIDGSSIQSIKTQDEIKNDFKDNKIINNDMQNINLTNTDAFDDEQKEKIGVIKNSGIDLDGVQYDTKTNLAFTKEGDVLDTSMKTDGAAQVKSLGSDSSSIELPKNDTLATQNNPTNKVELFKKIDEMYNNNLSKEEAKSVLEKIPEFNDLSTETKDNIYNSFGEKNGPQNMEEKAYTPTLKYSSVPKTNENSGIASSIIIAFVSGMITGVAIMVLVYFMLTH